MYIERKIMIFICKGVVFDFTGDNLIYAKYSPYLDKIMNLYHEDGLLIERDSNGYIILDLDIDLFNEYVKFLYGQQFEFNDEISSFFDFMGHRNHMEYPTSYWKVKLRDNWIRDFMYPLKLYKDPLYGLIEVPIKNGIEFLNGVSLGADAHIAGGFALFMSGYTSKFHDMDIFFTSKDSFMNLLLSICGNKDSLCLTMAERYITVNMSNMIKISQNMQTRSYIQGDAQMIFRLYKAPTEIVHGFDLDCVGFIYTYDNKSCSYKLYATERALYSVQAMTNYFDPIRSSPSYASRLVKYHKRGFNIHLPFMDVDNTYINIDEKYITNMHRSIISDIFDILKCPNVKSLYLDDPNKLSKYIDMLPGLKTMSVAIAVCDDTTMTFTEFKEYCDEIEFLHKNGYPNSYINDGETITYGELLDLETEGMIRINDIIDYMMKKRKLCKSNKINIRNMRIPSVSEIREYYSYYNDLTIDYRFVNTDSISMSIYRILEWAITNEPTYIADLNNKNKYKTIHLPLFHYDITKWLPLNECIYIINGIHYNLLPKEERRPKSYYLIPKDNLSALLFAKYYSSYCIKTKISDYGDPHVPARNREKIISDENIDKYFTSVKDNTIILQNHKSYYKYNVYNSPIKMLDQTDSIIFDPNTIKWEEQNPMAQVSSTFYPEPIKSIYGSKYSYCTKSDLIKWYSTSPLILK